MGLDAGTPPGLWERVQRIADDAVVKYARSGFLRNASISDGGLTIKGGFLRLLGAAGDRNLFYIGPITPALPDGTRQQGLVVRRADGTIVLIMQDLFPDADGTLNQALSWLDRSGNVAFADDTDSGQGIARPYLSGSFARARYGDWTVSTTSTTFETLWMARVIKQQPKLEVSYRASMDTAGATGETRVLVNGVQIDTVRSEAFAIATRFIGPAVVPGNHMDALTVEIQARTTGTGAVRVEPTYWQGRQS